MDTWIWDSIKTIEQDKETDPIRVLVFGRTILSYIIDHISDVDDNSEALMFQDFIYIHQLTSVFENWVFDVNVQDCFNAITGYVRPIDFLECGVDGIRGIWRTLFGYKRNKIDVNEWINVSCEIKLVCIKMKDFIEVLIKKHKLLAEKKEEKNDVKSK